MMLSDQASGTSATSSSVNTLDENNDGILDIIDINRDGKVDVGTKYRMLSNIISGANTATDTNDENKDGIPDNLDRNRDGKIDEIVRIVKPGSDENEDGIPDNLDLNRDGKIDQKDQPLVNMLRAPVSRFKMATDNQVVMKSPRHLMQNNLVKPVLVHNTATDMKVYHSNMQNNPKNNGRWTQVSNEPTLWPILNDYSSSSKSTAAETHQHSNTKQQIGTHTFRKKFPTNKSLNSQWIRNNFNPSDYRRIMQRLVSMMKSRLAPNHGGFLDDNKDGVPDMFDRNRDGKMDSIYVERMKYLLQQLAMTG